jgi:hypothetical protein
LFLLFAAEQAGAQDAVQLCREKDTDDDVRPIPRSLVPAAKRDVVEARDLAPFDGVELLASAADATLRPSDTGAGLEARRLFVIARRPSSAPSDGVERLRWRK